MLRMTVLAGFAVAAVSLGSPAAGQDASDFLRDTLYGGTSAVAIAELEGDPDTVNDPDALLALGVLRAVRSFEIVVQSLYQHGFVAPDGGPMLGTVLSTPIPANPNPEPWDYDGVRSTLQEFVTTLDLATEALTAAADGMGETVVDIEVLRIRLDIDGDGVGSENETMASFFGLELGSLVTDPVETEPPANDKLSSEVPTSPESTEAVGAGQDSTIGFDAADAIWLAGYSQIVATQVDFVLAHDFSSFVNAIFHRMFPEAGFPMQGLEGQGTIIMDPQTDTLIADVIAAIHTLNWPVIEPDRLAGVADRALAVLELSRRNWSLILRETDDHRELVPSPTQTALVPDMAVTQEMVDAWLATLDTVEQIVNGQLLLPHWRFDGGGFDLHAYLTTAQRTDLVMLLTGYDAIPFIKDGPVVNADSFGEANRVFGPDVFLFAIWFN